jgi:hypothetical protein
VGFVAINAFVALRVWLGLLDAFSEERMGLIRLSPFWKEGLRLAVQISLISPEATFVVPVFIWIAVTLRSADLERLGLVRRKAR